MGGYGETEQENSEKGKEQVFVEVVHDLPRMITSLNCTREIGYVMLFHAKTWFKDSLVGWNA
jgi:hypothetical protein